MSNTQNYRINISAPNLINICVDVQCGGEISGRLYHCYSREPVRFTNVIELIRETERFFDDISFPQASTKTRHLREEGSKREAAATSVSSMTRPGVPPRLVSPAEVIDNTGELGTFITTVRYRQNATWQGEYFWLEKEEKRQFTNLLDFIKQIDSAVIM